MEKERIGLFGGTFNPVHSAHLKAAEAVRERFHLGRTLFIPSFIPPHKETCDMAGAEHRFRMVELALGDHPGFEACPVEIESREKSYSILTLMKIRKQYPEARLLFLLGVDAFVEIKTWKDYERLLEQCLFIVIHRQGYELKEARNVLKGRLNRMIHELTPAERADESLLDRYRIFLLPVETPDISSTEIRMRIKTRESISGLVPEAVENFIRDHGLYA